MSSDEARLEQVAELRVAVARLEQAYRDINRIVDTFGPTAGQLIKTEANVDQIVEDLDDLKQWIAEVERRLREDLTAADRRQSENAARIETACSSLGQQLTAGLTARINARALITVAAISAAATILAGKL